MKSERITVGDWIVDPVTGEMSGPEGEQRLEPMVLKVLLCLVEQPGDVVTRDELLAAVWGERAVSDEPLNRCIRQLRAAFRDTPAEANYIRTYPRVGYALVAPTGIVDRPSQAAGEPGPAPPAASRGTPVIWRSPAWIAGILAAGVLIVAVLIVLSLRQEAPSRLPSIAVLPFDAQGLSREENYLGAGLAEEVRLILGQVPELPVVASQSSEIFEGSDEDVPTIAEALNADYVLDGTIQVDGPEVNVFVRLNSGKTGYQLWSDKYQFSGTDIFTVQTRIANSAAAALFETLGLTPSAPDFDVTVPTSNVEAYDYYLRGRHHLNLRNNEDLEHAVRMFDEAIARDPGYGMPYVAKAYAVSLIPSNTLDVDERSTREARDLLRDAIEADPSVMAAAEGIQAYLDLVEWRFVTAYERYRSSLDAFPNEPIIHHGYSLLMSSVGRHDDALEHARIARSLDVLSPVANGRLAVAYLWTGDNDRAAEYFRISSDLGIESVSNLQAYLLLLVRRGDFELAEAFIERIQASLGSDDAWWDVFSAALRRGSGRAEDVALIERAVAAGQISLIMQLGVWALLGEEERALDVIETMFARKSSYVGGFLFASELEAVRRNPRFGEVLKHSPLPRFWREYGWPPLCSETDGRISCR